MSHYCVTRYACAAEAKIVEWVDESDMLHLVTKELQEDTRSSENGGDH